MRSFFLLVVLGLVGRAFAADLPALDDLEGKIIASRKAIKSGEFEVRVRSSHSHFPEKSYHTWLGNDGQIRQERDLKTEFQVSIFTHQYAYYFAGPPGSFDNPDLILRNVVERVPLADANPYTTPHLICDPRRLMFTAAEFSLLPYERFDTLLASSGRENVTIKPITWDDQPAFAIAFRRTKFDDKVEYDVVPSRSFNIVRQRLFGASHPKSGGEFTYDDTATAELTQFDKDTWFPTRVHLEHTRDGKPRNEDITLINARLNVDIPDEVFTLGYGNKLPPKQLIIPYSQDSNPSTRPAKDRSALWWDGKQVRPLTRADEAERNSSHKPDLNNQ